MCILPYCYYGTLVSLRLQSIGDYAYANALWYKYPLKIQKYVQLTIAYSQRRKNFHGFNIFNCSLEVFMKVFVQHMFDLRKLHEIISLFQIANASASYYLMFKSF